jgi:hypothetical protein
MRNAIMDQPTPTSLLILAEETAVFQDVVMVFKTRVSSATELLTAHQLVVSPALQLLSTLK